MSRPARRVALLIFAAAVLCWVVHNCRLASRVAESSAQRALLKEVHGALELHYRDHRSYPRSLHELQITNFQDGATPAMLHEFRYESDGTTYTIHYVDVASRQTIVVRPNTQTVAQ